MRLNDRIRRIIEGLPEGASVTLTVAALQGWLTETDGEPRAGQSDPTPASTDQFLNADEAAEILGVNARWMYRNADSLPFTRRLSPRQLRFSEKGLRRWMDSRR